MNRSITKKLEMAARVQEWQRANPPTDRNQAAIGERFEALLAQAQALFLEEHSQRLAAAAATRQRNAVRRTLQSQVVRTVARIGAYATRKEGQAASRFVAPPQNVGIAEFLARTASLLEAAREHQDALLRHGLTKAQLTAFAAGLAGFREAISQEQAARQLHGATRVALERVVGEVSELVGLIDAFNTARYEADARMQGLWRGARVLGRGSAPRAKRGEGAATAPATAADSAPPAAPGGTASGSASPTEPPPAEHEDHAA
jgi:hypothetical protein